MNWKQQAELHKDAMLRDLQDLLKIASVKNNATSTDDMPMGREIAGALDYMLELSRREGLQAVNIDGYAGFAEYGGWSGTTDGTQAGAGETGDYIGILCHLDVVPATGEWTTPPFSPTIRDGKLFARGAIDDKGPTMAAFYGLKMVKELGLPLKHNVRIIFGTDEESGMRCMSTYMKRQPMPIAGFAPDADFPITHAEKGQVNARIMMADSVAVPGADNEKTGPHVLDYNAGGGATRESSGMLALERFQAGGVANMVPAKAETVISGEHWDLSAVAARFEAYCAAEGLKGSASLSTSALALHMEGKSAHGMEPHIGVNAGLELIHFLRKCDFQPDANRYLSCIDTYLYGDCLGRKLGVAYEDDISGPLTVNVGILEYSASDDGDRPFFHLNIRFPVSDDGSRIVDMIERHVAEYGFVMEQPSLKKPHHVPSDHPMIRALQRIYAEETGLEPTLLSTGGGTYASTMECGVAFGAMFPGKEYRAHQPDECIEIDELLLTTAIYARAIYELANLDYS